MRRDKPLEKRKWYQNTKAVIGLVGGLPAAMAAIWGIWPKPDVNLQNVEIVFDRSAIMDTSFGNGRKLDGAKNALSAIFDQSLSTRDSLALREFGGECGGENTKLVEPFKPGNLGRITNSLKAIKTSGRSTLVHAVVEATGDFNSVKRFRGVGTRIVVVTGSFDECYQSEAGVDPATAIRSRIQQYKKQNDDISLDLRFIGVALTPEDEAKVSALAVATGGSFLAARDPGDLSRALQHVLVIEPGLHNARAILSILEEGVTRLNTMIGDFNNRNLENARKDLDQAEVQFKTSDAAFSDLANRQGSPQLASLYKLAGEARGHQQRMIDDAYTMIAKADGKDDSGKKALDDFNSHVDAYNQTRTQANEVMKRVGTGMKVVN